jgi:Transposase
MMSKTRREFAPEFKREAVALPESSGRPLTQVASELGIQPSMLRAWCCDDRLNPLNTCVFAIQNAWPKPGSNHQSAASATPRTTPSPKPSTACSRPRSSITAGRGAMLKRWNSQPSNEWTGSTTDVSSNPSAISRLPRRRQTIMPQLEAMPIAA